MEKKICFYVLGFAISSVLLFSPAVNASEGSSSVVSEMSFEYATYREGTGRHEIQDRSSTVVKEKKMLAFFNVFDGHKGYQLADHLNKNFYATLKKVCKSESGFDLSEENIIKTYDELNHSFKRHPKKPGSTAVTILFNQEQMVVAHAGDSRALQVSLTKSGFDVVQLTKDHRWSTNLAERERVQKFLPPSTTIVKKESSDSPSRKRLMYRSSPPQKQLKSFYLQTPDTRNVALSESDSAPPLFCLDKPSIAQEPFSYSHIKTTKDWKEETGSDLTRKLGLHRYCGPITHEPEVNFFKVELGVFYLIISSDGFSDYVSNEKAAHQLHSGIEKGMALQEIAKALVELAASKETSNGEKCFSDDTTVIVVKVNRKKI